MITRASKLFVIAATLMLSVNSYAADGSSGCGPGWYVSQENTLLSSVVRAITNSVLFPVSTIGMTVGTSNCAKHEIVENEKEALYFATMNYFEIKKEMAQGGGEFLAAFSQTIGCSNSANFELMNQLKSNYDQVMPKGDVNPEEMLKGVYKTILTNPRLRLQCGADLV